MVVNQRNCIELVDDVSSLMQRKEETWSDKEKISNKFCIMGIQQDYASLCHEVLLNDEKLVEFPKIISTGGKNGNIMIGDGNDNEYPPLMGLMNDVNWKNGLKLFYSTLLHFDRLHDKNGEFVKQYMSHKSLQESKKQLKL